MTARAVIDVGTNSIKLLVADYAGGGMEVLLDRSTIARLGEGSDSSGVLSPDAMDRALSVISEMAGEARSLGAAEIRAIGTQAVRASANSCDFIRAVRDACGVTITAISGEEEARLSYMAAVGALGEGDSRKELLVFDVGGGSSEIVTGAGPDIRSSRSLPVGALSLHRRFFGAYDGPVPVGAVSDATCYVSSLLEGSPEVSSMASATRKDGCCAGIGGTITTLAAVELALDSHDPARITGSSLGRAGIERQIALYSSMKVSDRTSIKGLDPKRADIILAGAG
ncbi:MAG: Ppx/GppA family phosphatase [Synergistaceae bacterium]|jgi:exopolyphosphatase/guanosine-5'-triphosphate,3'-diphosphate pyrophosphatase|nr:Ppx/GppA family phosphatase [Synergistaceae bacterium]